MKTGSRKLELRLAAVPLGVLLLAPTLASAQATDAPTLQATITTNFNQGQLYAPRLQNYNFTPFQGASQFSVSFGPETTFVGASYSGVEHDSTTAVQTVTISDAAAAVFNKFLSTQVNPNLNLAEITPNLTGSTSFEAVNEIQNGSTSGQASAGASFSLNTSTGSPFYSDGTNTYTASYIAEFSGSFNHPLGNTLSFSAADEANWISQTNFWGTQWTELAINKCAGTQCTAYSLTFFGNGSTAVATSSEVAPVPEADALSLSLAEMAFVAGVAMRGRRGRTA